MRSCAAFLALATISGRAAAQTVPHVAVPYERPAPPAPEQPPVRITMNYAADLNAVAAGGTRRGAAYLGKAALLLDADLARLIGLRDSSFHASAIDIHGVGLSSRYLGNQTTVSGIEAAPAIRLNQLWVETGVVAGTRLRVGKFAAAPSFLTSETASFFINATFGWPAISGGDLPQGGPAWPLAAPGAMLTTIAADGVTLSGAAFAGFPSGSDADDPQRHDGHGFKAFGLRGAPLLIGEVALARGAVGLKFGGWHSFAHFARNDGALPARIRGNWSLYGIVDWSPDPDARMRRLGLFARTAIAPGNRNPIPFYVDTGAVLKAPFAGRPGDAIGIAWSFVGQARDPLTRQRAAAEQLVELSYALALGASASLQPNVQFVIHPADGTANRRSAMVTGLRFTVQK